MRDASFEVETAPVLGELSLLKRKTRQVASSVALTSNRVTLGRELGCDVRLYFLDVSKLHAEIVFDEDSGLATLHVHGNNGLIHSPSGGQGQQHGPKSVVSLSEGDTFQIRKKLFRFSYTKPNNGYESPRPDPERRKSRRQSHRMSIVPHGKRFAPSPAKPRPLSHTPVRSGLSKEIEIEPVQEEEESLVFDELVGIADGDEGDKIYLEKREEVDVPQAAPNPFMTPQPKGKIAPRNTSAVPRTRTLTFELPDETAFARHSEHDVDEGVSDEPMEEEAPDVEEEPDELPIEDAEVDEEALRDEQFDDAPEPPQTPTPTSIPLPPEDATYSPMGLGGPRQRLVSPRSAYATPRGAGSDSLRKALLLRSARRAWENSRPSIESEMASGNIEVRRRRSGRRTLSPPPAPQSDSDSDEVSDSDKENAPQLQWVYENGQATPSQVEGVDDSDSDQSFETDGTIPGQGVLDFDEGVDVSESESGTEGSGEEGGNTQESEDSEEEETYESDFADMSSDIDDEVDRSLVAQPEEIPETKIPSPVASRFYTPQTKRIALGGARMSLAGIGPPVRFAEQPSSPSDRLPTGMRIPPTPSRLGKPEKIYTPARPVPTNPSTPGPSTSLSSSLQEDQDEEGDNEEPQEVVEPTSTPPPKTPSKATGLTPAQRTALATPLALPSAPAESFRDSVPRPVETPRRTSFIDALRQASAKKSVGFDVPDLPTPSASRSITGSVRRRAPATPRPTVAPIDEGDSESLPPTPTALPTLPLSTNAFPSTPAVDATEIGQETRHTRRRSLTSPSLAGLRDMLKTPKVPKTPAFSGVREMFKTPKVPETPNFEGVRELMREPKVARTPSFAGMREMFRQPSPKGGDLILAADLFPEVEPEQLVEKEGDEEDEEEAPTSPETSKPSLNAHSRVPTRPTRSVPVRSTRAASASTSAPTRAASTPDEDTKSEPKSASTRSRRAAKEKDEPGVKEELPARNTRQRAAPSEARSQPSRRVVSAPAPQRVTRSRTAEPEPAPDSDDAEEPEAQSVPAPARRSRRVLGEAEQRKASASGPGALAARKTAVPRIGKEKSKEEVESIGNKENSATPDPEAAPRKRAAVAKKQSASSLPVRVTRSRKA